MKKFLELIEVIKRDGIYKGGTRADPNFIQGCWEVLEICQPFVFSKIEGVTYDLSKNKEISQSHTLQESPPFPTFSVEIMGAHITAPEEIEKAKVVIDCIVCSELSPGKYFYLMLAKDDITPFKIVIAVTELGPVVDQLLKRLSSEQVGTQFVRERVKIGTGKTKKQHTFRKVIHISPKKLTEQYTQSSKIKVDWSHRWSVRGHWRKLEGGLGKNREGIYCVENFTWVTDSVKGPESAPLIPKVRLIQDNKLTKEVTK